jgi:hypothetical protein
MREGQGRLACEPVSQSIRKPARELRGVPAVPQVAAGQADIVVALAAPQCVDMCARGRYVRSASSGISS